MTRSIACSTAARVRGLGRGVPPPMTHNMTFSCWFFSRSCVVQGGEREACEDAMHGRTPQAMVIAHSRASLLRIRFQHQNSEPPGPGQQGWASLHGSLCWAEATPSRSMWRVPPSQRAWTPHPHAPHPPANSRLVLTMSMFS